MLEAREADIPVLFLVLVVLPVLAYVLLGKWSDNCSKRERVRFLAQLAAEEALRARARDGIVSDNNLCANCFSLATTRCARCKSIKYCSGKCQIIHWRLTHKQECNNLHHFETTADWESQNSNINSTILESRSKCVEKNETEDAVIMRKTTAYAMPTIPVEEHKEGIMVVRKSFDDRNKKTKTHMLFPYDEFVKFFQCQVFALSPRGLLNTGNSCYANAVLQCLTCTKPLLIYLLRRSHSRTCCGRDWCLMCELEQHVKMLRESGGPLSPSRILSHIRSINSQIGDGSQEDAHEFLRLLIASMQSICLEGLGGESKVDSRLQETTFIQHAFGGRLRSKVKCLRCHHESERYENIMDLTLEIYGWVESLEDALTQFTTSEDLEGENMYRCGRCAAYVQARKQLSIHEAPNILTIVLKRFKEGRYGKINKRISFPEMLDMIPYMTGTVDVPPLYALYGVVVHLDTSNASFSGHYVSYVKDLRGNWFRIDDTEIHPVPMRQVMSEGAYILFYMRSSPRPKRIRVRSIEQKSCIKENCKRRISDAASSDWSLFTSSDEASFTTESTRDSFSTVDYADADPFLSPESSSFYNDYNNRIACKMFSNCRPQTRFRHLT